MTGQEGHGGLTHDIGPAGTGRVAVTVIGLVGVGREFVTAKALVTVVQGEDLVFILETLGLTISITLEGVCSGTGQGRYVLVTALLGFCLSVDSGPPDGQEKEGCCERDLHSCYVGWRNETMEGRLRRREIQR